VGLAEEVREVDLAAPGIARQHPLLKVAMVVLLVALRVDPDLLIKPLVAVAVLEL
jgi:hypothetical protein